MDDYIQELRQKYDHPNPKKPQLSPHAHIPIDYGEYQQIATPEDTHKPLDTKGVKQVQGIVGVLQYVARAVNNKLLVAISTIVSQQVTATANTNTEITQMLDYVATYPDNSILFRASSMVQTAHADTGFLNEAKVRSRSGAQIFLNKYVATPPLNRAILKFSNIINSVMESAAKAELTALYITVKTMVPIRNTIKEIG